MDVEVWMRGCPAPPRLTPPTEAGVAAATLKCSKEMRLTTDPESAKMLSVAQASHNIGVGWSCAVNQSKQVVPVGAVVYVTKQVIIPPQGEVRL